MRSRREGARRSEACICIVNGSQRRGPREQEKPVETEERQSDVAPRRPAHDQEPRARDSEGEERGGSPLAGGDPDAVGQEHHRDESDVRGVEDVLAVPAEDELRGHGDEGGGDREQRGIRPEEEAEREAGDEGAAHFHRREARGPGARELPREDGTDQESHARRRDVEVEEGHPVEEEGRESADLKKAWVLAREAFENHRVPRK